MRPLFASKLMLIGLILLAPMAAIFLYYVTAAKHSENNSSGGADGPSVVVYTSVDDEYAQPLFERFTKETGIRVIARTDSEATKTTGLAERLVRLKDAPDGDVFWNSELSFTQVLAKQGVLAPYISPNAAAIPDAYKDKEGLWTGFGCRARVLVFNTAKVKRSELPKTLEDLALPRWKGKFAVAKPLFGTTRSHLVALALKMGEDSAMALFRAWRSNGVVITESNGDVRNRVADGSLGVEIGLTDTDDVFSAMDRGKPVDFALFDQTTEWKGTYLIPNTVGLIKGGPNEANGKAFIDYLLKPETEKWLAEQGARQVPVRNVGANVTPSLKGLNPATVDATALSENVLPLGEKIHRVLTGEAQ